MAYIAIKDCELKLSKGSAKSLKITTNPSNKVKVNNKGCYFGTITIAVSGFTSSIITDGNGTGIGILRGTAKHCKIEKQSAVLEGDKSTTIIIAGTQNGSSRSDTVTVTIKSAKQKVLKGV
jgi:hypothetical protein